MIKPLSGWLKLPHNHYLEDYGNCNIVKSPGLLSNIYDDLMRGYNIVFDRYKNKDYITECVRLYKLHKQRDTLKKFILFDMLRKTM